jgi:serine/threonine protein kinase
MSMIGKSLIHYEITAEIGRGGMGEVYQAKDTKLGRDVAIKVLPEEFATDSDRVARFQREAKLLASLNHPNIAAIHGLEESDGTHFLVMELIEGDTLNDRIKSGSVPVEEALKLALQMAEALEAAHEKGVIHRDLKPANIKVTPDGKVKILDFGLAKAYVGDQGDMNLADSPTISAAATQKGVILGTAAYMSPEQARGKPVDKRADIWAFGVVLFEMLTGRQAFQGEDVSVTLASVITSDVNLTLLPTNIHPRVREVINRCLQKESKKRYSGISDAQYEMEQVLSDPSGILMEPVTTLKPKKKLRVGISWITTVFILGLIIAGVAGWYLKPSEKRQVTRFSYELPKDLQFGDLTERAVAVSPDGSQLVYCTNAGLYLRSMDELDARLIDGTEGAQKPFFSPDSQWIGYVSADSQLKKVAVSGGAPVSLAEINSTGFINWEADDSIVYGQLGSGIMRVSSNGGIPEIIVKAESRNIIAPQTLSDGRAMIFTEIGKQPFSIFIQSIKSGESKELLVGDTAYYLQTGHIVYAVDNNLFAIPFNPKTLEITGGPISMVEGVLRAGGAPQYAVSDSGTLIYMTGTATLGLTPKQTLVWVDRNGNEEPLATPTDAYSNPRISPDGTRVASTIETGGNQDIRIWDLVRKTMMRLTFDAAVDAIPIWSLDGKQIFFASRRDRNYAIHYKAADGTGAVEYLGSVPNKLIIPHSWSSDGKTLCLMEWRGVPPRFDIGVMSMEGDRQYQQLLQEEHSEAQPKISPNGNWMAYVSDESGQREIYVRPFPEVDKGRWQVSTNGGDSPLWSPDGRELFYRNGDAVMTVTVRTEPTFSLETPKILFRGTYVSYEAIMWSQILSNPWDIDPDGKRFLMIKEAEPTGEDSSQGRPRRINIILNWDEELKQRVPVD